MPNRWPARLPPARSGRRRGGWEKALCCVLLALAVPFSVGGSTAAAETSGPGIEKVRNPYTEDAKAAAEGRELFLEAGCPKCHGRAGTGGDGANLTDDVWVISGEDGVLFQIIMKGRERKDRKTEMPAWEEALEPGDVWKIIAWLRSLYRGDKRKIVW